MKTTTTGAEYAAKFTAWVRADNALDELRRQRNEVDDEYGALMDAKLYSKDSRVHEACELRIADLVCEKVTLKDEEDDIYREADFSIRFIRFDTLYMKERPENVAIHDGIAFWPLHADNEVAWCREEKLPKPRHQLVSARRFYFIALRLHIAVEEVVVDSDTAPILCFTVQDEAGDRFACSVLDAWAERVSDGLFNAVNNNTAVRPTTGGAA